MKVILLNGSPNANGCTYTALCEVAWALQQSEIETEIVQIGNKAIQDCIGCGGCAAQGACVFEDGVNETARKIAEADGLVIGSPVYYAGMSGALKSYLDRLFYSSGKRFAGKVGAGIVSARRGGTTATFDELNKYFTISRMPVASSQYWNQVHGSSPEDVKKDLEGLQIMRILGRQMAWLLRCIEAGKEKGIPLPEKEEAVRTNFIR